MEKEIITNAVNDYLKVFPEEQSRQKTFINYLNNHNSDEITDWNNFNGHICASGFVYSIKEQKFLTLYHKDMKIYLYPGGHIDPTDETPIITATREVKEETGLTNFQLLSISSNDLVPFDIDTHKIGYNERLNLPEHYHFDFRYLFVIPEISNVEVDESELGDYKWISMENLKEDPFFGNVSCKIERLLKENKLGE